MIFLIDLFEEGFYSDVLIFPRTYPFLFFYYILSSPLHLKSPTIEKRHTGIRRCKLDDRRLVTSCFGESLYITTFGVIFMNSQVNNLPVQDGILIRNNTKAQSSSDECIFYTTIKLSIKERIILLITSSRYMKAFLPPIK